MATKTVSPADSAELQKAFDITGTGKQYDTLLVEGEVLIDAPTKMRSGTTLKNGGGARFKLMDAAPKTLFPGDPEGKIVPLLGQAETTINNVVVDGIEFFGNKDKQIVTHGKNYHDNIYFNRATNITIKNCYFHDSQGDAVRIRTGSKLDVSKNVIHYIGHDGIHFRNCVDGIAEDNVIACRINSGVRAINSSNVKIRGNIITGYVQPGFGEWSRGGPGIQIERSENLPCGGLEIYDNLIMGTYGPGMYFTNYGVNPVSAVNDLDYSMRCTGNVHHNLISDCGQHPDDIDWLGGIVTSGWYLDIKNNTLYGNYRYGIVAMVGNTVSGTAPKDTGFRIVATNNIIANTKEGPWKTSERTGIGVANLLPGTHTIVCKQNNINGSATAAFKNAEWDDSNINVDPCFAEPGLDFHLKSAFGRLVNGEWVRDEQTSACIYSNGEIGMYNGTETASKYVLEPVPVPAPAPIEILDIEEFLHPSVLVACDTPETLKVLINTIKATVGKGNATLALFNVTEGFKEGLDK